MKQYLHKCIAFILLSFCMYSCNKDATTCFEPKDVKAQIGYVKKTVRDIDTIINAQLVDTIITTYTDTFLPLLNARILQVDSPLSILGSTGAPSVYIFLNPSRDSTTYEVAYDTTAAALKDTVTVYHRSYPQFISSACGYTYYFTVDSVTVNSSRVDSSGVINAEVTRDATQNNRTMNLYFF